MALNNLLNLPPSKVALKPPLPPLPTRPSLSAPPRGTPLRRSLTSRSEPTRRLHSSASSPPSDAAPSPTPPSSREDAVAQARSCLAAALQKPLGSSVPLKKLKRQRQRQPRLRAEIPVVDDSPASLARLALDVFSGGAGVSRKGAPARLLLVWPSAEALAVALREFESSGDSATAHAQLGSEAPGALSACDAAVFLARFSGGGLATFEATRFALGRKNAIRIEVNGSLGSLAFDFEDMNVLEFFDGADPDETAGFRRIVVTEPGHPYVGAWWPAGHGLGYEHAFTHQVVDLVGALAAGEQPTPSFADGLAVQRVLDAVQRSAADRSVWTPVPCSPRSS